MNTRNLSKFGYIEKQEAGKLLLAMGSYKDKTRFIGSDVSVEFNPNSGNVFLVDEDCNVAMLTDEGILEDIFTCPYCGHEGFLADMKHEPKDKECKEYLKSIKI
jgi:hypothetical protein